MVGPDAAYYRRVVRWSSMEKYGSEISALFRLMDLPRGARVLDLGCATGASTRALREVGAEPIGLDAGEAWMGFCRDRPVVRADAARLPFASSRFDAVILMHSLAHLEDSVESLREARRVLVPGGRVGIATPNLLFLRVLALRPGANPGYAPDPTVERHFARSELIGLLRRAGLAVSLVRRWGPTAAPVPLAVTRERLLAVAMKPA